METAPVSAEDKLEYITAKLDSHIRSFQSSVNWYRGVSFYTSMATLMFSGLITIITGWKPELRVGIKTENLVLILAALITVVSAWGMFFSPKDSWLIYASSLNRLRALKAKIEFTKREPDFVKAADARALALYDEYQAIFDAHNKAWLELRTTSNPSTKGAK
jgi:hypothetical protein